MKLKIEMKQNRFNLLGKKEQHVSGKDFAEALRKAVKPALKRFHAEFSSMHPEISFTQFVTEASNPTKEDPKTARFRARTGSPTYRYVVLATEEFAERETITEADILKVKVDGALFEIQNHPRALAHVYRHASRAV